MIGNNFHKVYISFLKAISLCFFLCSPFLVNELTAAEVPPAHLDPDMQARALDRAVRLPRLRSLLLSVDGEMVLERYFNGARPSHVANLKSASKSVLSALVGIAIDRGYLRTVREPIGKFFPEYFGKDGDPVKKGITLEDLLTMRSGLESTSHRNYGRWVRSDNWVRHVLERPLVDEARGRMIYSTGNFHLLSAILTKATGMSTFDFADQNLAAPLGIEIEPWMRDPQGIYFGGNEMLLTPRAMIKFGELFLNGGWMDGERIVSERWIRESLEPRARSERSGREYGYGWWIGSIDEHRVFYAWGHGGQLIVVLPDLRLVAVTTSATLPPQKREERRAHRRALTEIFEEDLIPAVNTRDHP